MTEGSISPDIGRKPRMMDDPKVAAVVREHARGEHKHVRLDCPVCRKFWPRSAS